MKKTKKLYICLAKCAYTDDKGKEHVSLEKYIGTINPLKKEKYFAGAWFDEDNRMTGSIELSEDDFKNTVMSCKELQID